MGEEVDVGAAALVESRLESNWLVPEEIRLMQTPVGKMLGFSASHLPGRPAFLLPLVDVLGFVVVAKDERLRRVEEDAAVIGEAEADHWRGWRR